MKTFVKMIFRSLVMAVCLVLNPVFKVVSLLSKLAMGFFVVGTGACFGASLVNWLGNDSTKMMYYGKLGLDGFFILFLCCFLMIAIQKLPNLLERLLRAI